MDVDLTEKLIQEVRKRPLLYLVSHPDYKNNGTKLQAWKEIQWELNEEVVVLKAKWKNLKDSYKKFKQSKQSTCSQTAKKLHNWTWADQMRFIDADETQCSITNDNLTNSTYNAHENGQSYAYETGQSNIYETSQFCADETGQSNAEETSEELSIQNGQRIHRRHRRNTEDPTDRMIHYLENRRRDRFNDDKVDVKCDGVDLLFLGYANAFKKLSKRKQINVKFDFAKILMEAELSDLDTATSRAPNTSFNNSNLDSVNSEVEVEYKTITKTF